MSLISFKDVRKSYGRIAALRGISLEISVGSIVALLGPNGAGKTTLFAALLGAILPDAGEIKFAGRPVTPELRTRFGYLAERVSLYPQRTIRENADYIAALRGADPDGIRESMRRVGMTTLEDRKASELSKGQLQRAGLAIALAGKPDLLVLDEPFNGLDPVVLDIFLETIREERQRGATILISTHSISVAEEVATHVAVLLDGSLAASGGVKELHDRFQGQSLESIYRHIARSRSTPEREAWAA